MKKNVEQEKGIDESERLEIARISTREIITQSTRAINEPVEKMIIDNHTA